MMRKGRIMAGDSGVSAECTRVYSGKMISKCNLKFKILPPGGNVFIFPSLNQVNRVTTITQESTDGQAVAGHSSVGAEGTRVFSG